MLVNVRCCQFMSFNFYSLVTCKCLVQYLVGLKKKLQQASLVFFLLLKILIFNTFINVIVALKSNSDTELNLVSK